MQAMLDALSSAISSAVPVMLITAGAIAAVIITIPIAKKAYRVVMSFLGH